MKSKYKKPVCPSCNSELSISVVLHGQGTKEILKNGAVSKLNIGYIDEGDYRTPLTPKRSFAKRGN